MVIFDCNGVLVDSEPLATAIVSQEFIRAGFALTPDIVARYFTGRRPADMFAEVEIAAGRKLPADFAGTVASATLSRFRVELRATKHAVRQVKTMDFSQSYEYLAETGKAMRVGDKEDSYNAGLRQFLDEKTYKPTFEPFRLGSMLTDQRPDKK